MDSASESNLQNNFRSLITGFNGFEQWPGNKVLEEGFSLINNSSILPEYINGWKNKITLQWCYNVFLGESNNSLNGFYGNGSTQMETPMHMKFCTVSGNDRHILLVNSDGNVWELLLESKNQMTWKSVPNFLAVEGCDSGGKERTEDILKVACGETMNLVLTNEGNVFDIPSKVVGQNDCQGKVIDIACGYEHAILLTDKGNVYTWGSGSRCQLGHGDIENREHPELVNALAGIVITKIAAGGWHCCAVSDCGDLYTWGWNEKGQLGCQDMKITEYSTEDKSSCENQCVNYALPKLIDFYLTPGERVDKEVVAVACGSKHTVVKLEDDSIWAAGWNGYCQLGLTKDCKELKCFKLIKQNMKNYEILCSPWSTVLLKTT